MNGLQDFIMVDSGFDRGRLKVVFFSPWIVVMYISYQGCGELSLHLDCGFVFLYLYCGNGFLYMGCGDVLSCGVIFFSPLAVATYFLTG
jgi:hypothetical protein